MSLDRAIYDMNRFSQGGFSQAITFTNKTATKTVIVRGLVSKHNLSIDPQTGTPANARNVHISVSEKVLKDAGYTTRTAKDEISLKGHKVQWKDSTGTNYVYLIEDVMPSMTIGLLVMTLGEFE